MTTARSANADVVVVGAGAVGASVAYELSRRGVKVIVLDRGAEPGAGCSYANAGLLSPSHVEPLATPANILAGLRSMVLRDGPFHISPKLNLLPWLARLVLAATPARVRRLTLDLRRMAAHSLALHEEYARLGDTSFCQRGSMDVYLNAGTWARANKKLQGITHGKVLDGPSARDLEPALTEVAGAVYLPNDAHVNSLKFVQSTLAAARAHGAQVRWSHPVTQVSLRRGVVSELETPSGAISAGHVVLCAGIGTAELSRVIGVRMPLQGAKGYVIDLSVERGLPTRPLTFKEDYFVATPYPDRLRLAGILELGQNDRKLHDSRLQGIRRAAHRALPELKVARVIEMTTGLRPCAPDGLPVIGPSHRIGNLYYGAGHGKWGIILAPVTGQQIAQGIVDGGIGWHPDLSPDRFSRQPRRRRAEEQE